MPLVLSELIFFRDYTCEDLRRMFDVEYLPLAETPSEVGLAYEEDRVPTRDAQLLRVWYLPTNLDRGTVVLSQGAFGSMPCFLFHARLLVHNGWSVVMYEYRGFGESSGEPDIAALHTDLETVLDWTLARAARDRVTLMGISLGCIPTIAIAVARPDAVNGVVLDSPLALGATIQRLEFALPDQTQDFIDRLPPELDIEELIKSLTQPLLILLGEKDHVTPPASVQVLYDRAPGPKELVLFPDIAHARAPFFDTGAYMYHVEKFLSSIWSQYVSLPLESTEGSRP